MNPEDHPSKQEQLEQAIAAQERLRGTLDDAIVDTTLAALNKQLDELLSTSSQPEQQRKIVTVLFVDVVNSTRMIQDMDPEESMDILDVSLHKLAEPIRKYCGSVNRYMGDGFLVVFGAYHACWNGYWNISLYHRFPGNHQEKGKCAAGLCLYCDRSTSYVISCWRNNISPLGIYQEEKLEIYLLMVEN